MAGLGDYVQVIRPEALAARSGHPGAHNDELLLFGGGRRLVVVMEARRSSRELLNLATGGDPLPTRPIRRAAVQVTVTAGLAIVGNPPARGRVRERSWASAAMMRCRPPCETGRGSSGCRAVGEVKGIPGRQETGCRCPTAHPDDAFPGGRACQVGGMGGGDDDNRNRLSPPRKWSATRCARNPLSALFGLGSLSHSF